GAPDDRGSASLSLTTLFRSWRERWAHGQWSIRVLWGCCAGGSGLGAPGGSWERRAPARPRAAGVKRTCATPECWSARQFLSSIGCPTTRVQLFSYSIELIYHTVVPASVVTCASSSTSFFNSARAMGESMEM